MTKFKGYAITQFNGARCSANPLVFGHPTEALTYTLESVGTTHDTYVCQCKCGDSRRMWTYAKRKKRK
jgi:hypothetical protein